MCENESKTAHCPILLTNAPKTVKIYLSGVFGRYGMIKIRSLKKIYKSKKKKQFLALNNINLTLPDSGLVFVLGKSGSGKSTLLNLIGGLDNISSGKIEVDGNNLATFSEKDFANYRNTHIGFIFQDSKTCTYFNGKTTSMSYTTYNEIFGTSYDATNLNTFEPHSITVTSYRFYDVYYQNPLYTVEIFIDGLGNFNSLFVASDLYPDTMHTMLKGDTYYYGLYFDGTDGIGAVLDMAEELCYEPQSYSIEGIHTMTRAVEVFVPIFELIGIILCIGVVFILVSFSTKMIKDKMHEIGILKALGAKNTTISIVFGLQILLIATLTAILTTLGYYLFIDIANDVLIESLTRLASSMIIFDIDFLTFIPLIAIENCALIALLAIISMLIPLIRIRGIKPVKIIKTKD